MFVPFFAAAMTAPARHAAFRRVAVCHTLIVAGLSWAAAVAETGTAVGIVGQILLVVGIVEGAALIGWRLTQLPKSQALEFFLVSPVQPRRLFLAEATVGIARFALISVAGWPIFGFLVLTGRMDFPDLYPFAVMPLLWGIVAGVGLTAWVYEPTAVRRCGELLGLLGVLAYLVIGVVAGENFRTWLLALPESVGRVAYHFVLGAHELNPFGVVRYWFEPGKNDAVAWDRMVAVNTVAAVVVVGLIARAACRLRGHFHDRHYKPIDSSRAAQTELIGDRPLSWWTVRRVMEYSGRVNLWLANGFALVYAAYLVAGDAWPAWMGRLVFQLFETWGGAPVVATALAVLAAVPAVYQYGLWDSTPADRCRRLELLLLTDLRGSDYAHAAFAAAWKRGRAYLIGAFALWVALAVSGRIGWADATGAVIGAGAFWAFAFAVGFRGFASGHQTNGVASLIVLGLPVALYVLLKVGLDDVAAFLPTAASYLPAARGVSWPWAGGLVLLSIYSAVTIRRGLSRCESDLRSWYDANQGRKSAA